MVTKVAITGVNGFIGSTLSNVFCKTDQLSIHRLKRDKDRYNTNSNYDAIIHCGEQSDIAIVNSMTDEQITTSIENTKDLIKKTKHFIYLSSSAVYPKNLQRAAVPCDACATNRYTARKIAIEDEVIKSDGTVLRLSNVFGDNMSQSNIFNDVYKQLHKDKITVRNKAAERDYIHVLDVVDIIEHILLNNVRGIFNVSSGQVYTITDVVELIFKSFDKSDPNIYSLKKDTPDSLYLECNPLNSEIRDLQFRSLSSYIELDFKNG